MAEDKKALSLEERLELQRVEEGDEAIKEEGTANSSWSKASSRTAASSLGDLRAAYIEYLRDNGPAAGWG